MSLELTLLVLLAALMHAVWNALVKASADRLVEIATLNLTAGTAALALLPWVGLPGWQSVPFLAGNMIFQSAYYFLLIHSYHSGGLSLVYPIARGSAPLLVAVISVLVLDVTLGATSVLGVVLIAVSIASLALAGGRRNFRARPVLFSLATGASIAGYTLVDGSGARIARTPYSYIACLFILNGLILLPAVRVRRRGFALSRLRAHLGTGAFAGLLSLGSYGIAVWAMTRAPIAFVAALRETSVVVAAAIGALFLGEPFGRYRILAAMGVAGGVVLLRLGS